MGVWFYRMYGRVFLSYAWACVFLSNVWACVFIVYMSVCFYRRYGRVSIEYDGTVVQTFYIYITFIIPLVW